MIEYDEPGADGGNVHVRLTDEEAVAQQRAAGLQHGFVYPSDEAALEDFITVNWAWRTV